MKEYDAVDLEILSSKMISIVEEAANTLLRTCYSSIVRDSRDFTCTITDAEGQLLAQAPHSLPAFTATMPRTVRACLETFPADTLKDGDVLITNNPWIAIGHLPDVVIITPIFFKDRLVAFGANAANVADIGGRGMGVQAGSIYEEGLQIPILKLFNGGIEDQTILKIIRQNVRMAHEVIGDIRAQIASNEVCKRRLVEFLEQSSINDLNELAAAIQSRSEEAMRRAIREIPNGEYSYTSVTHGVDSEIILKVSLHVKDDEIIADYTGSSPQSPWAINSVLNYTFAYTAYAIKCVIAPHIPNNEGCFRPIKVTAPKNTIVNPSYPAPVAARSQTGKFLPIPVMRALAQAVPDKVIADSGAAPLWCPRFSWLDEKTGRDIRHTIFMTGGMGARSTADGISAIDFPSVIVNVPAELHEHRAPILVERWNLKCNSGGAGTYRGGLGFDFVVRNISSNPINATLRCERTEHPALGVSGGLPGSLGSVTRENGEVLDPHGSAELPSGDALVFSTAGGGGFGTPLLRTCDKVLEDVKEGLISIDLAHDLYSVVIDPESMTLDLEKTRQKRAEASSIIGVQ